MKQPPHLILGMMLLAAIACNNNKTEEPTTDTKSAIPVDSAKSIIIANNLILGELLRKGDTTGWAEMFSSDACQYPSNMQKVCGSKAISEFAGYAWRHGFRDIKVNTEEVLNGYGFFVEVGTYEILDSTGKSIDKGKTMVVWKEENGRLKLHRDFFNTDLSSSNNL